MDIRDEIKASKVDKSTQSSLLPDSNVLPKSSLLLDSDQNKPQLSSGVKGIDRVSLIKSKDTGNSDSPKRRRIMMSERDMLVSSNAQPVSQYNPITGELIMSSANVNFSSIKPVVSVKKPAAVVEKPDAVVDKAPKHKAPAKKPASVVVQDKDNVAFVVVQDKENPMMVVVFKKPCVAVVVENRIHVVGIRAQLRKTGLLLWFRKRKGEGIKARLSNGSAFVVGRVCDVAKQIMFHVGDALKNEAIEKASDVVNDSVVVESVCDVVKASDALKNKAAVVKEKSDGKGQMGRAKELAFVVGSVCNVVKEIAFDVAKDNAPNPKDNKSKVHSDVVPIAEKPKPNPNPRKHLRRGKGLYQRKMIEKTKLKGKSKKEDSDSELETNFVDSSSDEADQKRKKLKIKAGLNRKRSGSDSSDSSSIDTAMVKRLISFSSLHNVSIDQLPSKLGWFVVFKFENYMLSLDIGDKIEVGQFHPVELRDLRVNDIARKLVAAKEIDFLFKVNFLTLFTNTMGKADGLKGQICLDVLLYLDSTNFERAEKKLASICSERVRLEDLLRKANSDYHGDGKFVELQEKNAYDVGGDGNGNEDDAGNGDDEDGGCKSIEKQVDATKKEVDATTKDVDAMTKENAVEESDEITFIKDMRRSNEGTVTPERLVTRHSKASPIDCWAEILNYEDRFRNDGSLSRHFFPTGCITKSMFDGTLSTYEEKWKSFAAEVSAQFKDNVGGLALSGIDLARILKLKWKTKANVKDCGIFTMLHMESYMGQTAKTWDCGLVAESKQQCDMLRQLRFKFATKILLHEINVHAQKMIRYAEEFDKIVGFQKMCIVVDALKNREEREKN
ncbi:hypothetical protein Tco_0896369 [Tanacetum coccineum]